jgi:DNA-binding protein Fis
VFQKTLNNILPTIAEVLEWAGGNQCRTALALGISRGTLRKKMQIHNID